MVGAIIGLLIVAVLYWPSRDAPAARQAKQRPIVTTVKSQSYRLGVAEHMLLIDIPDRYVPRRCAVYVNETTRSTIMNCNFDSVGEPFPQAAEE